MHKPCKPFPSYKAEELYRHDNELLKYHEAQAKSIREGGKTFMDVINAIVQSVPKIMEATKPIVASYHDYKIKELKEKIALEQGNGDKDAEMDNKESKEYI